MKSNIGNADRGVRLIAGLSLMAWGFWARNYWGFLGLIPLLTAFFKWCPLYLALGLNTCKKQSREIS